MSGLECTEINLDILKMYRPTCKPKINFSVSRLEILTADTRTVMTKKVASFFSRKISEGAPHFF